MNTAKEYLIITSRGKVKKPNPLSLAMARIVKLAKELRVEDEKNAPNQF